MMAAASGNSQSTSEYNQEEKKLCRTKLIQHAIKCLTTDRDTSVCVYRDHVRLVWNQISQSGEDEHFTAGEKTFIEKEIRNWEVFHESQIQTRKPSDLRVCYLGGDNPMNDMEVLVDNGVLSQNIWAIEKNTETFKRGCEAIREARLRNVRLFKGDILNFFKDFESQFDIIYFDACGSLPAAKQKTLKVIGYVFLYNKLTSPGSLITTFSFPPKTTDKAKDVIEKERLTCLAKKYLISRLSNTSILIDRDDREENLRVLIDSRDDEKNYSDYVSCQIVDSASLFIPAQRMLSSQTNSLWDQIFMSKDDFLEKTKKKDNGDHPMGKSKAPQLHNLVCDLQAQIDETSQYKIFKAWANEIFPDSNSHTLPSKLTQQDRLPIMASTHLLSYEPDSIFEFVNDQFQKKCLDPIFDIASTEKTWPNFHSAEARDSAGLVAGILYGQMACPSFPVLDKSLRLKYTAKERQMFSDVFIFDKCRYLYEQFPSVHCACFAIWEPRQLMVIRMVVDGFRRHIQGICSKDFFPYCEVVNLNSVTEGRVKFEFCQDRSWPIPERQLVDKKFEELKQKGNRLAEEEQFHSALEEYNRCLKLFPDNKVVICANKALCYLKLNQLRDVVSACDEALSLDPRNRKARYRRAMAKQALGPNETEAVWDVQYFSLFQKCSKAKDDESKELDKYD